MAIYMKYADIKGDTTQENHKEWITLNSFQWGVGRGISSPTGSTERREASEPSVSEVTISKMMDESSNKLFERACVGTKGEVVKIHVVRTGSPGETFLEYILTNTLVSGYSVSSGGDNPSESLSLNFTKIEVNYTPYGADNTAGTTVRSSYDMATAKKG